jgi:hypothetical protein
MSQHAEIKRSQTYLGNALRRREIALQELGQVLLQAWRADPARFTEIFAVTYEEILVKIQAAMSAENDVRNTSDVLARKESRF